MGAIDADGGPQIGQPMDTNLSIAHGTVSNFTAANTGDDSIAFFNDGYSNGTGTISTVTVSNSFAREINLNNSRHVALSGLSITGHNSENDVPQNMADVSLIQTGLGVRS